MATGLTRLISPNSICLLMISSGEIAPTKLKRPPSTLKGKLLRVIKDEDISACRDAEPEHGCMLAKVGILGAL